MSFNKDTGMYEGYIYLVTNNINGKQYIGQTIRKVIPRFKQHIIDSRKEVCDTYFHQAIKKHGKENFKCETILTIERETKERLLCALNDLEVEYIKKYKTLRPDGYNTAMGGYNLPNTFAEKRVYAYDLCGNYFNEYRSMCEASSITGTQQSDISKCCNGVIKSANGYIWSFEKLDTITFTTHKRPVDIYRANGEFIETLMSMKECEKYTSTTSVSNIVRGLQGQSNGYVFRYHGEPFDKYDTSSACLNRMVNKYDKDDIFIETYDTIASAKRSVNNSDTSSITKCCRGKLKTAYGYKWFYADDPNQPDKTKIIDAKEVTKIA